MSTKELNLGIHVLVSIGVPQLSNKIDLLAQVVRCMDHADGWYTTGLKFIKPQSHDDIIDLHAKLK